MAEPHDLELDGNDDTGGGSSGQTVRKNISIKLKTGGKTRGRSRKATGRGRRRKAVEETEEDIENVPGPPPGEETHEEVQLTTLKGPPEPLHRNQTLRWDHKVNLIGEKIIDPTIHCCEKCMLPILIYGRMIPCKHVFCFDCAKKTEKNCARCNDAVHRIEQSALGTVFVCNYGGTKHGVSGCRRTYLSQRDLQAHINYRHVRPAQEAQRREAQAREAQQREAQEASAAQPAAHTASHTAAHAVVHTAAHAAPHTAPHPVADYASTLVPQQPAVQQAQIAAPQQPVMMPGITQQQPQQQLAPVQTVSMDTSPYQNYHHQQPRTPQDGMHPQHSLLPPPPQQQQQHAPPPQQMHHPPPQSMPPLQAHQQPPAQAHMALPPHTQSAPVDNYQRAIPMARSSNLITVPIQDEGDQYHRRDQAYHQSQAVVSQSSYHHPPPAAPRPQQYPHAPPPVSYGTPPTYNTSSHPPPQGGPSHPPPPLAPRPSMSQPPMGHTAGPQPQMGHATGPPPPRAPITSHGPPPPRYGEPHPYSPVGAGSHSPWPTGPPPPRSGPPPHGPPPQHSQPSNPGMGHPNRNYYQ